MLYTWRNSIGLQDYTYPFQDLRFQGGFKVQISNTGVHSNYTACDASVHYLLSPSVLFFFLSLTFTFPKQKLINSHCL